MSDLFRDITLNEEQLEEFAEISSGDQSEGQSEGEPNLSGLERSDLVTGRECYEYILTLDNMIGVCEYVARLRERARELKCKTDFEQRVKPYVEQVRRDIARREKEQRAAESAALLEQRQADFPEWWDGQTIDEDIFCDEFLKGRSYRCINGIVYSADGMIEDAQLSKEIYERIKYFCKKDIAGRAKKILDCLKIKCYTHPLPPDPYKIHVLNGTIHLAPDGSFSFSPVKEFCTCRLNVEYTDNITRANVWRDFLTDLLEPQDVLTLQEFMGYCLIPSTRAQKMLLLVGAGGEGKSQIGVVMQEIFGAGLVNGELKDLDNGNKARFAREKLVERLVMLDDDTDLAALGGTSFLKQLVTAQIPLEVEPKGRPSFQTLLYSRVLAFGNGAISSLYDNSDGFYRRQIILKVKPRPADRADDRAISEKFIAEKQQIFMWALLGLGRLMRGGFEFTQSEQARQNLEQAKRDSCNIFAFMDSDGYFKRDPQGAITSKDLYALYVDWCEDNEETPRAGRSFFRFISESARKFGIEYNENVRLKDGKRARGYTGIVSRNAPTDPRTYPYTHI